MGTLKRIEARVSLKRSLVTFPQGTVPPKILIVFLKTDGNTAVFNIDIDDGRRQPEDLKTVDNIDINHVGHFDVDGHFTDHKVQNPRNKTKHTPPPSPSLCNSTTNILTNSSSFVTSFVTPPTITENLLQSTSICEETNDIFKKDVEPHGRLAPVFTKGIPEKTKTRMSDVKQRTMTKTQTTNNEQQKQKKIATIKQKLNNDDEKCLNIDEKVTEANESDVVKKETYICDEKGKLDVESKSCPSPSMDYSELGAKPKDG